MRGDIVKVSIHEGQIHPTQADLAGSNLFFLLWHLGFLRTMSTKRITQVMFLVPATDTVSNFGGKFEGLIFGTNVSHQKGLNEHEVFSQKN